MTLHITRHPIKKKLVWYIKQDTVQLLEERSETIRIEIWKLAQCELTLIRKK